MKSRTFKTLDELKRYWTEVYMLFDSRLISNELIISYLNEPVLFAYEFANVQDTVIFAYNEDGNKWHVTASSFLMNDIIEEEETKKRLIPANGALAHEQREYEACIQDAVYFVLYYYIQSVIRCFEFMKRTRFSYRTSTEPIYKNCYTIGNEGYAANFESYGYGLVYKTRGGIAFKTVEDARKYIEDNQLEWATVWEIEAVYERDTIPHRGGYNVLIQHVNLVREIK